MLSNTCRLYLPAGTLEAPMSILTPLRARSCKLLMLPGLFAGITTASLFLTKTSEASTNPAAFAFCIFVMSAEAKISAGAPSAICRSSICDPLKFNVILILVCARSYFVAISWNDSVSEAAAKTFRVVIEGFDVGEAVDVPPQAARNNVQRVTSTKKARRECLILDLLEGRCNGPRIITDTRKVSTHILSIGVRKGVCQDSQCF